jgi:hypothetical protein
MIKFIRERVFGAVFLVWETCGVNVSQGCALRSVVLAGVGVGRGVFDIRFGREAMVVVIVEDVGWETWSMRTHEVIEASFLS